MLPYTNIESKPEKNNVSVNDVPRNERGFRKPDYVQSVVLRMGKPFVEQLDELCHVNNRSRREIIEILVSEAAQELSSNPTARINPL